LYGSGDAAPQAGGGVARGGGRRRTAAHGVECGHGQRDAGKRRAAGRGTSPPHRRGVPPSAVGAAGKYVVRTGGSAVGNRRSALCAELDAESTAARRGGATASGAGKVGQTIGFRRLSTCRNRRRQTTKNDGLSYLAPSGPHARTTRCRPRTGAGVHHTGLPGSLRTASLHRARAECP